MSAKVKLGQLIQVENKERKTLENEKYIVLQVEDLDGQNERCLIFTGIEISDTKVISSQNWFVKDMVAGRIYPIELSSRPFYLVKIFNQNEDEKVIKLTKSLLNRAEKRAQNNKEDWTKKSFLTDLFD